MCHFTAVKVKSGKNSWDWSQLSYTCLVPTQGRRRIQLCAQTSNNWIAQNRLIMRRPSSSCTREQSDHSFYLLLDWTGKALIRLRRCTIWPEPSFIMKTCLFRDIEILQPPPPPPHPPKKKRKIQIKKKSVFFFLHISAQNIECGYSLEPPRRGGSNGYPQSVLIKYEK